MISENLRRRRADLLKEIRSDFQWAVRSGYPGVDVGEAVLGRVLEVIGRVPRHLFVSQQLVGAAYDNRPLPIGAGQTISQPFIVALMTALLKPAPDHVLLEVGCGCGYQAAVLASLVKKVYTLERIPALADAARQRLATLGYDNVEVIEGNGCQGYPPAAPFDGILTAAAADKVPTALLEQLGPGARLVIPLGGGFGGQALMLIEKGPDGELRQSNVLPVAFVPLIDG